MRVFAVGFPRCRWHRFLEHQQRVIHATYNIHEQGTHAWMRRTNELHVSVSYYLRIISPFVMCISVFNGRLVQMLCVSRNAHRLFVVDTESSLDSDMKYELFCVRRRGNQNKHVRTDGILIEQQHQTTREKLMATKINMKWYDAGYPVVPFVLCGPPFEALCDFRYIICLLPLPLLIPLPPHSLAFSAFSCRFVCSDGDMHQQHNTEIS